jgi:alpha,alpha-trehalase
MKLSRTPLAVFVVLALVLVGTPARAETPQGQRDALQAYIERAWDDLTRGPEDILAAAKDPKLELPKGQPWPVYVSRREDRRAVARRLSAALSPEDWKQIDLRRLPKDPLRMTEHGLLYLPHPYVVPGGRFNEMYGWDSFFIELGLLRSGRAGLARDMVRNFVYQIEHYGTLLNANRTYYLTRSQPPFLSRMVLHLYRATGERAVLEEARPALLRYYEYWARAPHAIPDLGLARYFDAGEGPAPEVVSGERDAQGLSHYDRMRAFYRTHEIDDYDVSRYYDRARDRLTDLFYKGDRSMRESGFDPSNRFGPGGVDIIRYAPVCLNSLLYQTELDIAEISERLGRAEESETFRARAEARRRAIDRHLWDEEAGLYLDYAFETKTRRKYLFASTFYPLWTGLASPAQAARVRDSLRQLEAPGGLLTSTRETGSQWDAPYGWAPLQWIAVEGLRRYGFHRDAERLARKFTDLVLDEFLEHGVVVEKYDVMRRKSDVAAGLRFGYTSNEVGFGWTNGVLLDLLASSADESESAVGPGYPSREWPRSTRSPGIPISTKAATPSSGRPRPIS